MNPNLLVAMNEPSLRKFYKSVLPGGWILFNGESFPADCEQENVQVLASPFMQAANELGNARAGNMVMMLSLIHICLKIPRLNPRVGSRAKASIG